MKTGPLTPAVQAFVRLLLGAILLPLIWLGFMAFSMVAFCSDKQLLSPRGIYPQKMD